MGRLGELKLKLVVVEATAGLQRQVVAALWTAGLRWQLLRPSWVRSYARGGGRLAKTDRIDARLLALFAQREQPVLRPPLDETQALQELATRRPIARDAKAEQQRLKRSSAQVEELRQHIAYLSGRITQIDDDIDRTRRRSQAWRRKSEKAPRSFLGKVFCTTVLSKLPELGTPGGAAAPVGIRLFPDDMVVAARPPVGPGRTLSGPQQALHVRAECDPL